MSCLQESEVGTKSKTQLIQELIHIGLLARQKTDASKLGWQI